MFRDGMRMFKRAAAWSCALLAALAACVVVTSAAKAGTALAAGDLLAGDNFGNVNQYGADGTLLGSISVSKTSIETGACEDSSGRVYQTNLNDGTITRIASDGTVDASTWASGLAYPTSCVVAPNGNVLVGVLLGHVAGAVALDSSGSVVAKYPVGAGEGGGGAWISLDRNNCTLNVANGVVITQYNICTSSFMDTLRTNSGANQTEQLPNGDLLVAADDNVAEVNASGVVRTYTVPGSPPGSDFTSLAIAADGTSVWVGDRDYGQITKISLSTGAVLQTLHQETDVEGLLVYRGTATKHLVALGDSVAAGEGINYGFIWENGKWVRTGPSNPTWMDTTSALGANYQQCHQSGFGYPNLFSSFGGNYRVYNMACTGASALQNNTSGMPEDGGVLDPEQFNSKDQPYPENPGPNDPSKAVPAQLGGVSNCNGCSPLNKYFNKHDPSIVLLTIGANDLDFPYWVLECYKGIHACNTQANTNLVDSQLAIAKADLLTVFGQLNNWAQSKRKPLRVVVTNYYDPMNGNNDSCRDYKLSKFVLLTGSEIAWLEQGLTDLNANIAADVKTAQRRDTHLTISLVDISNIMSGHQWCTPDPWAYGTSIDYSLKNVFLGANPAPFHPTPDGQDAIYQAVDAVLNSPA